MADLTATSTVTLKKATKEATQNETIAAIGTRIYTTTLPNPANIGDTVVLGKFPKGCAILGAFTKANAVTATTNGFEYGLSANANGAGATVAVGTVANGANTTYTYSPAAATAANASTATSANQDQYLVMTCRGANTAAVHTITSAIVIAAVDAEVAPYSTFTL